MPPFFYKQKGALETSFSALNA